MRLKGKSIKGNLKNLIIVTLLITLTVGGIAEASEKGNYPPPDTTPAFILLPDMPNYIGVRRDVIIDLRVDLDIAEQKLKWCDKQILKCKGCGFWKTMAIVGITAVVTGVLVGFALR